MEQLPFFVYGTLRNGFHNYEWALKGNTTYEFDAKLEGYEMYSAGPFPFIVHGGVWSVKGELMGIDEDRYDKVMSQLDHLEGYNPNHPERSHYKRLEVMVSIEGGLPVRAWTYIYNRPTNGMQKIRSGDWAKFYEETAAK